MIRLSVTTTSTPMSQQILVIHAHPRPANSVIIHDLLVALRAEPDVHCRSLYDLYPDFDIDVAAEQQALLAATLVIWLAPVHWYSVPALMKHWFDQVLLHGWAYGHGGAALHGKTAWWICSAGAPQAAYAPGEQHMRAFEDFIAPIEQTARFCGMGWLPPFVVYGGHSTPPDQRSAQARDLTRQLAQYRAQLLRSAGGDS